MKVLNREKFMLLPAGTIYSKGEPFYFGGISVKGDTIQSHGKNINWTHLTIEWIDAESSEDAWEKLENMLEHGASEPMETAFGRDSLYDKSDIFLVFETQDLKRLRGFIDAAITGNTNEEAK